MAVPAVAQAEAVNGADVEVVVDVTAPANVIETVAGVLFTSTSMYIVPLESAAASMSYEDVTE